MVEFYTTKDAFNEKFITLVKTTFPDLPIVETNQNSTQPVDILNDEKLMVFDVEFITKTGTDYVVGSLDPELPDQSIVMAGDREIQVMMELFSPDALTELTTLRDIWETPEYVDVQYNLGMMEKRQSTPPRNTTRRQSPQKYVTSAKYVTQFHMGIFYTAGTNNTTDIVLGDIETAIIQTGNIE